MFGCLLGAILFNKDPYLFYGSSNQVLLASIVDFRECVCVNTGPAGENCKSPGNGWIRCKSFPAYSCSSLSICLHDSVCLMQRYLDKYDIELDPAFDDLIAE